MMDDLMKVPIADDVITMTDCKERIAHMQDDAAFRHIIAECGADGRVWFDKKFICDYVAHLKLAVVRLTKERDELVGKTDKLERERDAAIGELRSASNNCRFCKWYFKVPYRAGNCTSPDPCCVDGNPDRWEWRGVTNE